MGSGKGKSRRVQSTGATSGVAFNLEKWIDFVREQQLYDLELSEYYSTPTMVTADGEKIPAYSYKEISTYMAGNVFNDLVSVGAIQLPQGIQADDFSFEVEDRKPEPTAQHAQSILKMCLSGQPVWGEDVTSPREGVPEPWIKLHEAPVDRFVRQLGATATRLLEMTLPSKKLVGKGGVVEWRFGGKRDGMLHRVDGPAVVRPDGAKEWFLNGRMHRVGGPAVEYANGYSEWYENGERHRVGGPAVEGVGGLKEWWVNGFRSRVDGPAVEEVAGSKSWYLSGQRHCVGGPAVENADGRKEWWEFGLPHRDGGPALEAVDGSREWWHRGWRHRDDGPALEFANGTNEWFQHDRRHRVGGPAVEHADGRRFWYQFGELHRDDGPAVEYSDGKEEYWLEGKRLSGRAEQKIAKLYHATGAVVSA